MCPAVMQATVIAVQKKAQAAKVAVNRPAKVVHRLRRDLQKNHVNPNIRNRHAIIARIQRPVNMMCQMHQHQSSVN